MGQEASSGKKKQPGFDAATIAPIDYSSAGNGGSETTEKDGLAFFLEAAAKITMNEYDNGN